ncbi:HAD family hydrolase [Deinococcus cellulosilyticus]|uniref:Haloacid dehalogenase n=1 Tax=Deinococcus cellulosilyticus (strain DSM 18568 / NBRC 106333 / KACC 11606 / 5516J-15) TaxID=1223518 RepID=A0A511N235_DEIC1|nr:HAD family hydrolase [Deinococcus cellulosilyticus]GEM46456.1 haloacid dehalogenase [Deinococcus cellulosilyticus NBRC 106333 = KACC 11606]
MIKAVVFNLDGTLLDQHSTVEQFLSGHLVRMGIPEALKSAYMDLFYQWNQAGDPPHAQLFEILQQKFLPQRDAEVLREDFARYAWQTPVLYPGTYTTLLELRSMGLKLGLITNGTHFSQRAKIAFSRLAEYIDVILISEKEQLRKPDPEIFQRALKRLGVEARQCAFVGDDPLEDITGAAQVGMKTAWVHHGRLWEISEVQPDWMLGSVPELIRVLSRRQPLKI